MSGGHFTHYELTDFARGEETDEIDALVEHLKACRECGDQLAVILALTSNVERRTLIPRLSRPAQRRVLQGLATAAAVAAAFLLYALLTLLAPDGAPADPPTTRDGLRALATTEPPAAMIVKFQLGITSPAGGDDTAARLQQAGAAVAERRYDAAIEELEILLRRRPSRGDIAAYLGIALYLSGDDSARVGELLSAASRDRNVSIATFAQWYYANFLLRTGAVDAAIVELRALAPRPTIPGRNSLALLDRLNVDQEQ